MELFPLQGLGIFASAKEAKTMFLSSEKTLEFHKITIRAIKENILFCEDCLKCPDVLPQAPERAIALGHDWAEYLEDRNFALRDLQKNSRNITRGSYDKKVAISINARTARTIITALFIRIYGARQAQETSLDDPQLKEEKRNTLVGEPMTIRFCLVGIVSILTQAKKQGVLIDPEMLETYQEKVNILGTLLPIQFFRP